MTAITQLSGTNGFLVKTDTNTWTLDTSSYATLDHTHDSAYAALNHNHTFKFQQGATFVNPVALSTPINDVMIVIPYNCTITKVTVLTSGGTGSCVIDIWKSTFANYPPSSLNTICGGSKPSITNDVKYQDSTLSDWTLNLLANDILVFNLSSVSGTFKIINITITMETTL